MENKKIGGRVDEDVTALRIGSLRPCGSIRRAQRNVRSIESARQSHPAADWPIERFPVAIGRPGR